MAAKYNSTNKICRAIRVKNPQFSYDGHLCDRNCKILREHNKSQDVLSLFCFAFILTKKAKSADYRNTDTLQLESPTHSAIVKDDWVDFLIRL